MHEYDAAFKLTLQDVDVALRQLTGTTIARWFNVELPQVKNARVDLLGEGETGELIHIELQATNDRTMPLRMLDYCLRIFRQFDRFPIQVVLYAGEAPLNMEATLSGRALNFSYRLVDVRDLDGERLLESAHIGDNSCDPDQIARRESCHSSCSRTDRGFAGRGAGCRLCATLHPGGIKKVGRRSPGGS